MPTAPAIDESRPSYAELNKQLQAAEGVIAEQAAKIEKQAATIAKQSAEIERLKTAKPRKATSRTSNKPPSSDPIWEKRHPSRKPSGKKRGGQPGHAPAQRPLVPVEKVDEIHIAIPEACSDCGAPLSATATDDDPDPIRHQVTDIPSIDIWVVEHQLHGRKCGCGKTTRAKLPEGVHQSAFGPNLTALVCLLTGYYRLSRRRAQRFIKDTYGISISTGAISNMERRMAEGLKAPHKEALASVANSPVKHLDETTWRESNQPA